MIAIDIPAALLVIGIIVLCVTTAVTALSLPGIELLRRRRAPDDAVSGPFDIDRPMMARRVVTGRPASLHHLTIPPVAPPAIALPAAPARQIIDVTDSQPTTVDDAQALIAKLIDDEPERLAELMMQWMRTDVDASDESGHR